MNKMIVFPNIDFADSKFSSVEISEKNNQVRLTLISWDERSMVITLLNTIQLSYRLGDVVSNFFVCDDDSSFLNEAIGKCYVKKPFEHPFKHYQLCDIDDFPLIEIVAESASIIKGDVTVGFDN